MRGDRQHRLLVAMAVVQAVDQVQVARAATAGAHGKLARRCRVSARCERRHFLVAGVHPADGAGLVEAISEPVQAVARHAPDACYTCIGEGRCEIDRQW